MKFWITTLLLFLTQAVFAQHSPNHVKHNMVLFGKDPLFASHLVYKQPHNFQVILQIKLDDSTLEKLEAARKQFPQDQFVLLLDHMDISQIKNQHPKLSGTLKRDDSAGNRFDVLTNVPVLSYDIIYFDEVPLSLTNP